jgi:nicotinic acid phosphoribosyltransferase
MIQAYLDHGDTDTVVFELFVRALPARRGFLLAAGLHQAIDFLKIFASRPPRSSGFKGTDRFNKNLLDYLADFRFSGDVHALAKKRARHSRCQRIARGYDFCMEDWTRKTWPNSRVLAPQSTALASAPA